MITNPPNFLRGSARAHVGNRSKRFKLYHKFWQLLGDVGLWYHPEYLTRKQARTDRDDPREVMPECVIHVSILSEISVGIKHLSLRSRRLGEDIPTQTGWNTPTTSHHSWHNGNNLHACMSSISVTAIMSKFFFVT